PTPRLAPFFTHGRSFHSPVSRFTVLHTLGRVDTLRFLGSYVKARLSPARHEETFEDWVTARFGRRLYRAFFKTYTEKVWGIPCSEIRADWAAQRIKGLSLIGAVANAVFGTRNAKSLIHEFHYPRLGPGQMWERFQQLVEFQGGTVRLDTAIETINRHGFHVESVAVREGGQLHELPADQVISSMPISQLIQLLRPAAPPEVL